jgi:hypothetical protein
MYKYKKSLKAFKFTDSFGIEERYHINRFKNLLNGLGVSKEIAEELEEFDFNSLLDLSDNRKKELNLVAGIYGDSAVIEVSLANNDKDTDRIRICSMCACDEGIYWEMALRWAFDAVYEALVDYCYRVKDTWFLTQDINPREFRHVPLEGQVS